MTGRDEPRSVRPGLRVLPGNDFVLPAGSITISLTPDGPEILQPIFAKARYQAWPDWLQIAMDAALAANDGRKGLLAATADGDEEAEVGCLMSEFRATLTAVTASAFALDSFYAVISTFHPLRPEERAARIRQGTGRSAWVFDAIRRVTKLTNSEAKSLREGVRTIYRLRDMAVHPAYELSDFLVHPGLRQAVPAVYVHYRTENAFGAVAATTEAIMRVADLPRAHPDELVQFARYASERVHEIMDEHVQFSADSPLRPRQAQEEDHK